MRLRDDGHRILAAVVHDHVGAEVLGRLEPGVGQIDGDDVTGAEQVSSRDGGEADGPGTDDGHDIAGRDATVEHTDLVGRGQDIGQHQELFVADPRRDRIGGGIGERHPDLLGLGPVDVVTQDPASSAETLPESVVPTEPAPPAGGYARDEHPVADDHVPTAAPTSCTVPTASWPRILPAVTSGRSPFRIWRSLPQMVVASTRMMASVSSISFGSGTSSQLLSFGP